MIFLILKLVLSQQVPPVDFTGYLPSSPEFPSWFVTSNACWTASLTFTVPAAETVEVWWSRDAAMRGAIKIHQPMQAAAGENCVTFAVLPGGESYFQIRAANRQPDPK